MDKRYIDANGVKRWLDAGHLDSPYEVCYSERSIKQMIDCQPTEDVAEVRHGKWRVHDSDVGYVQFACSLCGELVTLDDEEQPYPYCPNCGARMDAERIEQ